MFLRHRRFMGSLARGNAEFFKAYLSRAAQVGNHFDFYLNLVFVGQHLMRRILAIEQPVAPLPAPAVRSATWWHRRYPARCTDR